MIIPKFKPGDVLKHVLEETDLVKLHVIEVTTQTCPAKIMQVKYVCRVLTKAYKNSSASISRVLYEFNEIEVELWEKLSE